MTKISQGNKKITTTKILATNNKILDCTGSLTQPALFHRTSYWLPKHQKWV